MANTKSFTKTILASQVPSALTNFRSLIDLSELGAGHAYWTNGKSDGGDLRVYNSSGTRLPIDVVYLDFANNKGSIRFLADSISGSSNTVFTVEYGDQSLTQPSVTDQYGRNAVYQNTLLYHPLVEDPAGTSPQFIDRTGNGNDGVVQGTSLASVDGVLDKAIDFGGSSDYYEIADNGTLINNSIFAISFDVFPRSGMGGGPYYVFNRYDAPNNERSFAIRLDLGSWNFVWSEDGISAVTGGGWKPSIDDIDGVWQNVRFIINKSTGDYFLFVNGVQVATVTGQSTTFFESNQPTTVGNIPDLARDYDAIIQNVTYETVKRSDDYYLAEYRDKYEASTFYALSAEQNNSVSVSVSQKAITITFESGATLDEEKSAIDTNPTASELISVETPGGSGGNSVSALSQTNLSGGKSFTGLISGIQGGFYTDILPSAGVISGVVNGPASSLVEGATVYAIDQTSEAISSVITGSDGAYSFTGLNNRLHTVVVYFEERASLTSGNVYTAKADKYAGDKGNDITIQKVSS